MRFSGESDGAMDRGWSDKWALDTSQISASENNTFGDETKRAERSIKKSTRLAFAALFLAALVFGLMTYFLVRASQTDEFEDAFQSYARETADIAENNAEMTFGQLKVLSTAITSEAADSAAQSFPYINMPHFDLRTQEIADLTGIEMMLFVPFVPIEERPHWERFQVYSQEWLLEDYAYRGWDPSNLEAIPSNIHNYNLPDDYNDTRRGFTDDGSFMQAVLANHSYSAQNFSAPIAQYGPGLKDTSGIMLDLFTHPIFKKEMTTSLEYNVPVISEAFHDLQFLLQHIQPPNAASWDDSLLRSFTLHPILEDFNNTHTPRTIGYVIGVLPWQTFFRNLLPSNVNGIDVTIVSDCGHIFTYTVNGGRDDTCHNGDVHDSQYDPLMQRYQFFWKDHPKGTSRHCHFDLEIYPSKEFESAYRTSAPIVYSIVVVAVFVVAAVVLAAYDHVQRHWTREALEEKAQAEAIVDSLFPKFVGRRLMAEHNLNHKLRGSSNSDATDHRRGQSHTVQISEYLGGTGGGDGQTRRQAKPLADLFPFATIMFADIVGFTAWSSVREPFQVFTLLETLYQNFDMIAKRRRIFKVETIGDCYVAVSGLPEPRRDHAPAMAMFAKECLDKFQELVEKLEVELGPDTCELGLRTGLHSGPVTAGVLRGERARFQLFGDTVNTTARIEASGENGQIHLSEECAEELRKFGKGGWVVPREDKITAKGKGVLSTCWLQIREESSTDGSDASDFSDFEDENPGLGVKAPALRRPSKKLINTRGKSQYKSQFKSQFELMEEKNHRLIEWNTETLKNLLEAVVARRTALGQSTTPLISEKEIDKELRKGRMVFDEVAEIINLPHFEQAELETKTPDMLSNEIVDQIRDYVTAISELYPDNPFHNFDHASHVAMSVSKLLSRIVAPKLDKVGGPAQELQKRIHDHTYGITSDALTQFACVFSSLIHDCEHDGVPNAQLVKEEHAIAARYNNISVAEQNSVDVAWNILMGPRFQALRSAIYSTEAEMVRFRQLVVNSVMATDIVDKKLKELRNGRWEKAFQKGTSLNKDEGGDDVNRKATIVIEHLIQASDVSHTMQHWHIFHRWNENLFREMYTAYKAGRSEKDPSEFWYKGEIGFFDFYIIPLAKKLKDCGVFGVSSDEYLIYAQSNRREWERKGEDIVKGYIEKYEADSRTKKRPVMEKQLSRQMSKSVLSISSLKPGTPLGGDFSATDLQHDSMPSLLEADPCGDLSGSDRYRSISSLPSLMEDEPFELGDLSLSDRQQPPVESNPPVGVSPKRSHRPVPGKRVSFNNQVLERDPPKRASSSPQHISTDCVAQNNGPRRSASATRISKNNMAAWAQGK